MATLRTLASLAHAKRAEAGVKLRQPLPRVRIAGVPSLFWGKPELEALFMEEINVKKVDYVADELGGLSVELDTTLTPELQREGELRDLIRALQAERKAAGLSVDQRVRIYLKTDSAKLKSLIASYERELKQELRADEIKPGGGGERVIRVGKSRAKVRLEPLT